MYNKLQSRHIFDYHQIYPYLYIVPYINVNIVVPKIYTTLTFNKKFLFAFTNFTSKLIFTYQYLIIFLMWVFLRNRISKSLNFVKLFILVEAGGFEPPSEGIEPQTSPGAVSVLGSREENAHW